MTGNRDTDRRPLLFRAASEGNWFFVIAGLALLNALLPRIGLPVFFVAGLAAPLLASNRAHLASSSLTPAQADAVGYSVLALCILVLVALGWFACKGHAWAFAVGAALYIIDGIAFLMFRDLLSFSLHLFILYFVVSGLVAALRTKAAPAPAPASPGAAPQPPEPPRADKPLRPGSLYPG